MSYPGQKYRQEQNANQKNQNNNNQPPNQQQYGQQSYAPNQNFGGPGNGMPGGNMSSPYNQPQQQFPNQPPQYNIPPMNVGGQGGMPMPGFNNGPPSFPAAPSNNGPPSFGNGPPGQGPPSFSGMPQTPMNNNGSFMPMPSSDLGYAQPSSVGGNPPYALSNNYGHDSNFPSSSFPLSSSVGSPLPSDHGYNNSNRQQQYGNNGPGHQQPMMNSQQPQHFPPPQVHNPAMFNQPPPHQPIPNNQPVPPGVANFVEVSNFSGRKKALLIGINYFGTKAALRGCINDVRNVQSFINRCYGFRNEDMVILTDDQKNDPTRMPTRSNMIQAMRWLVEGARPNDSFFFHFSGHGSQQKDTDGDESDGYDETICPMDYEKAGMIVDDELNTIMVRPLPQGCRLTAIFDCCHSGTALDLPYIYDEFGKLKSYSPAKAVKSTFMDLGKKYMMGDTVGALMSLKTGISTLTKGKDKNKKNEASKSSLADVVMFSGCMDNQTSADAFEKGVGATGAMSFALIKCLSANPHNTPYIQLLNNTRAVLKDKYTQVPMLSSGRPMDMNVAFNM